MTDYVKIGLLAITGVLLALPLKKEKGEYSLLLSFFLCVVIFGFIIGKMQIVLEFVERLESLIATPSEYVVIILKMIGIAYLAEFTIGICKDAGCAAIGGQVEVFAKISILVVSLPVLLAFLEMIGTIL